LFVFGPASFTGGMRAKSFRYQSDQMGPASNTSKLSGICPDPFQLLLQNVDAIRGATTRSPNSKALGDTARMPRETGTYLHVNHL